MFFVTSLIIAFFISSIHSTDTFISRKLIWQDDESMYYSLKRQEIKRRHMCEGRQRTFRRTNNSDTIRVHHKNPFPDSKSGRPSPSTCLAFLNYANSSVNQKRIIISSSNKQFLQLSSCRSFHQRRRKGSAISFNRHSPQSSKVKHQEQLASTCSTKRDQREVSGVLITRVRTGIRLGKPRGIKK